MKKEQGEKRIACALSEAPGRDNKDKKDDKADGGKKLEAAAGCARWEEEGG